MSHEDRDEDRVRPEGHGEPWEVIARSGELAEIGYWADRLEAEQIETRVQPDSDFHAMDGSWHSSFALCVVESKAAAAREWLREWAAEEHGAELSDGAGPAGAWQSLASYGAPGLQDYSSRQASDGDEPSPRLLRAFVFAILAGSIGYYAGMGSLAAPPRPAAAQPGPRSGLWQTIQESDEAFATSGARGQPRSRLRFDRRANAVVLEVETRPGGPFEVRKTFPAR